jgi:rsbT co-antagonist protein RsbR
MSGIEKIEEVIRKNESKILKRWIKLQLGNIDTLRRDLISEADLRTESATFLQEFTLAIRFGIKKNITDSEYEKVREFLIQLWRRRAAQGFTPSETVTFLFSLKEAILPFIEESYKSDVDAMIENITGMNNILDKFGLQSFEEFTSGRDELIKEQADSIIELSLPVMKLWDDIVSVPVIGTLDSRRAKLVTESLLNNIVEFGYKYAIIDISGVPIIDSQVANHLLKTVRGVKLLGAKAILTGIRPEVAQVLVELGVDLSEVITSAVFAGGLEHAFKKLGYTIEKKR